MRMMLLESNAVRQGSLREMAGSVLLHIGLVALAVWLTARIAQPADSPQLYDIIHFELPAPGAPDPGPAPGGESHTTQPSRNTQTTNPIRVPVVGKFEIPTTIPTTIPDIVLDTRIATNADGFGQRGGVRGGGTGGSGMGGTGSGEGALGGQGGRPYSVYQVEVPARLDEARSRRPTYPAALRSAGAAGTVDVEFVIDTSGRYESSSLRIVSATHELFGASVRAAMPNMRFYPALVGGQPVRQLVRQTFQFTLER